MGLARHLDFGPAWLQANFAFQELGAGRGSVEVCEGVDQGVVEGVFSCSTRYSSILLSSSWASYLSWIALTLRSFLFSSA